MLDSNPARAASRPSSRESMGKQEGKGSSAASGSMADVTPSSPEIVMMEKSSGPKMTKTTTAVSSATVSELHRRMSIRTIGLIGLGGGIGTALFVSIGKELSVAGPGGLLLAFVLYAFVLGNINSTMAEMTTYMPVSGGFVRLAGYWVDDALGFAAGWNFFFYLAVIVPFEITALSLVVSYWSVNIPVGAICAACVVLYLVVNIFTVRIYGATEFSLCSGKVLLMIMLIVFTLVAMCGGNPQHDAFGFRHWTEPAAFLDINQGINTAAATTTGRFEGFLSALFYASFTCNGPEFISVAASEVRHPRKYVKKAHKMLFARILFFYIGGCLAVTVILASGDKTLQSIYGKGSKSSTSAGSAAASPFIIAMENLKIQGLPHVITALFAVTIFSAGNAALYAATRTLYGLALEGRAPRFLTKVNQRSGVPVYCLLVTMIFPLLSFLQLSSGTATVLAWLINIATSATLLYMATALYTYIRFHRACQVQKQLGSKVDRDTFPFRAWFQPYGAWFALVSELIILFFSGYRSVISSPFSAGGFVTAYFMPVFVVVLFVGWKVTHKTKLIPVEELDLVWEAPLIDAYEASLEDEPVGFWRDIWTRLRSLKKKTADDDRKRDAAMKV